MFLIPYGSWVLGPPFLLQVCLRRVGSYAVRSLYMRFGSMGVNGHSGSGLETAIFESAC